MTFSKRNDDGFTLVELLVSMALLSLMAIYTLNAFSAMRNMNRVVDAFGEQMEVEAVQRHLRGAIADMRPVFKNDANSQAGLLFEGEADRLAFVVASNGDREVGGLYFVQYFVNENGDLIVDRNLLRDNIMVATSSVTLLRNVKDIGFQYFDQGNGGDDGQPMSQWNTIDRHPAAVEINITFVDGDKRTWQPTLYLVQSQQVF